MNVIKKGKSNDLPFFCRKMLKSGVFWTLSDVWILGVASCTQSMGFGNTPSVAVCESGERDRHDASEWTFVIVGLSKREVESQCSQIEEKIERTVDARVMNIEREFI